MIDIFGIPWISILNLNMFKIFFEHVNLDLSIQAILHEMP